MSCMNCKPSQLILFGIVSCCFHSLVSQKNKLLQYYCILGKRLAFSSFNLAVSLCKRVNAFWCLLFFNLILVEAPTSLHPTSNTIEINRNCPTSVEDLDNMRSRENLQPCSNQQRNAFGFENVFKYLGVYIFFFCNFFKHTGGLSPHTCKDKTEEVHKKLCFCALPNRALLSRSPHPRLSPHR